MILYELLPNKALKSRKDESTFVTENLISSFNIIMPSTFGNYPSKELDFELRVYLPTVNNGQTEYSEYMGYPLTVENNRAVVPITNDITGDVQIDKVMILATKDGNVIGKTNFVDKPILDAPLKGEPLTPRKQFDEVIREQRETIAEQSETITNQGETITQQGEQITELNGEVSELSTENTRLENLTDTQRETIQNMIDNPPQPKLYTPPEPIIPESETKVYTPPQNYDGFASFVVKGTKLINPDLSTYFKREEPINLTFDQPLVYQYLCYGNSAIQSVRFTENVNTIAESCFNNCAGLSELTFSVGLRRIANDVFAGCTSLFTVILPQGLQRIEWRAFLGCTNLTTMFFPNSLTLSNESSMLTGCSKLQYVTLENGFNSNGLHLEASTLYSVDTIVGWLEALADRTGQATRTLTIGTTNLNKLTSEQKAIATNKNWNLA